MIYNAKGKHTVTMPRARWTVILMFHGFSESRTSTLSRQAAKSPLRVVARRKKEWYKSTTEVEQEIQRLRKSAGVIWRGGEQFSSFSLLFPGACRRFASDGTESL